jgi:hypothetical protein
MSRFAFAKQIEVWTVNHQDFGHFKQNG